MRIFDPWVGSLYASEGLHGLRILILGESHYDRPGTENAGHTIATIRKYAQKERNRFYSTVQRLVSVDSSRKRLTNRERQQFWEKVAFYNYVQEFVGKKSRLRPTSEMWSSSEPALHQTVRELEPDLIVVVGKELKRNIPKFDDSIAVAYVTHISGRGFSYKKFMPIVKAAIAEAKG